MAEGPKTTILYLVYWDYALETKLVLSGTCFDPISKPKYKSVLPLVAQPGNAGGGSSHQQIRPYQGTVSHWYSCVEPESLTTIPETTCAPPRNNWGRLWPSTAFSRAKGAQLHGQWSQLTM